MKAHPKARLLRPRWLHLDKNFRNEIDHLIPQRGKFGVSLLSLHLSSASFSVLDCDNSAGISAHAQARAVNQDFF